MNILYTIYILLLYNIYTIYKLLQLILKVQQFSFKKLHITSWYYNRKRGDSNIWNILSESKDIS